MKLLINILINIYKIKILLNYKKHLDLIKSKLKKLYNKYFEILALI
jgi:hypothetical protein